MNKNNFRNKKKTGTAVKLSEDQIDEFREVFDLYDLDGNGSIDFMELRDAMSNLGQNLGDDEIRSLLNLSDQKNDGEIDFPEFIRLMTSSISHMQTEEELRESFKVFDEDGSGSISAEELRSVLRNKLPPEEIDLMIKYGDTDGDGEIDYSEFVKMIMFK